MSSRFSFFALLFLTLIVGGTSYYAQRVLAEGANLPMTGWMWSSNIGWISFCGGQDDAAKCPGTEVAYHVEVNNDTGEFSGYAWSSTLGYLTFNHSEAGSPPAASGCGSGVLACIDEASHTMKGWGRFLGTCDRIPCPSSDPGLNSGAWDGWVHFSSGQTSGGQSYTGVQAISTPVFGQLAGYSWGGEVVGWVYTSTELPYLPPEVRLPQLRIELTASPATVRPGQPVNLTATVETVSGRPIDYEFDCDNGEPVQKVDGSALHTVTVECRYAAVGTYNPTVTVKQGGVWRTAIVTSNITNVDNNNVPIPIQVIRGIIREIPVDE